MSKKENKTLVPKLRFPEFRDAAEWEEGKLGEKDISSFVKERMPLAELNLANYVSTENLLPYFGGVKTASKLPPTGSFTRYKKGDILISNIRPYLKKVWSANKDGGSSNDVIVIRAKSKVTDSFLTFLLKNDEFINYVMKGAKGVKMPRGDISLMKEYPVAVPNNPKEQQKIADCLSSVDELITTQTQKVDALKAHKKGLMQQLFPAEGETVPKLRFPEFRDAGEWQADKLGSLIEIKGRIGYRGYTVNDIVQEGEGAITLSPSNIDYAGNLSYEKSTYISWYKYEESPEIMLEEGFTVLVKTGSSFGKAALVQDLPVKATINPQIVVLKPLNINSVFLYMLVSNYSVQKQIRENAVGGAIPTLSQDKISKFDILVPSVGEQQKIADCLLSIDDQIASQIKKLDILKTHKKGLMQQLFPSVDEVNG